MYNSKVDIFVLSGFLGSGKSTLLNDLVQGEKNRGRRIGVLMNELGDISIDSSAVPKDTPLKEMLNGCICCSIQGELSLQLKLMLEEHDLDVIYIEATGAANPLDVVDACTHPVLAEKVTIKTVITTVNAKQWHENKMSIKLRKLLIAQVKFADVVLINKIDQVSNNVLDAVQKNIEEINNQAIISHALFAKINPSLLYSKEDLHLKRRTTKTINESHVHHHLHVRTVSISVENPIDRIKFLLWLKTIQGQLYRVKGFIHLKETPGLFLFNFSYDDSVFERYKAEKEYRPVLVFIGEELDKNNIEEELLKLQH